MQTDIEVRQPAAIERNKAIVLKFYGEHDLKVQGDLLAPEFVGRAPGVPRFDRAGFLRGLAELYAAFPDGRYVNDNIEIGRASCRERVENSEGDVAVERKR